MPKTLGWHETLEIHELVASQTNCLTKCKASFKNLKDAQLKELYTFSIQTLENNVRELLPFYKSAPRLEEDEVEEIREVDTGYFAGELLSSSKSAIKNYAAAITETATPALKTLLTRHLNGAIDWHTRVFNYMYQNGQYPAYNLSQLLSNDVKNANKALKMKY